MLFCRTISNGSSSFSIPLAFTFEVYDDDGNVKIESITFKDFLNSAGMLEELRRNHCFISVGLVKNTQLVDDTIVPIWHTEEDTLLLPITSNNDIVDYTSLVALLQETLLNKEDLDPLIEQMEPHFGTSNLGLSHFTKDNFEAFYKGFLEYYEYTENQNRFSILVKDSFYEGDAGLVRNWIDRNNISYVPLFLRNNSSKEQRTPDDVFNLSLPSLEELHLGNLNSILPSEWCHPLDYEQSIGLTRDDLNEIERSVNKSIAYLGSKDNANNAMYDNEIEFYNRMKSLIDEGIKFTEGGEITDEKLKASVNCGKCDSSVKTYLLELACLCYVATRPGGPVLDMFGKITGESLLKFEADNDDSADYNESDDDTDTNTVCALHISRVTADGKRERISLDANEILMNYIEDCASSNTYLLAEAVIKLARWGERKTSILCLGDSDDGCLDLENFSTRKLCKDFSKLEVQPTPSGADMYVSEMVYLTDSFKDIKYLSKLGLYNFKLNLPVGIMGLKQYKEASEQQFILVSIVDALEAILRGEKMFEGISIENNKVVLNPNALQEEDGYFTLEEELNTLARVSKETGDASMYIAPNDMELYTNLNTSPADSSVLCGLQKLISTDNTAYLVEKYNFTTSHEFKTKVITEALVRKEMIEIKLATKQLTIILRVAEKLATLRDERTDEVTLDEILNLYLAEILGINEKSEDEYSKKSDNVSKKMEVFTEQERKVGEYNMTEEFIAGIKDAPYGVLVHDSGAGIRHPVGYFHMTKENGGTKIYLATLEEKDKLNSVNKKANLRDIIILSGQDLAMIMSGKKESCKLRFSSMACLQTYLLKINQIMKTIETKKIQDLEVLNSKSENGLPKSEIVKQIEDLYVKDYVM